MKQLEVQIMGQSYLLGCPDGGDARLLEAVERVDTAMCRIRDGGKVRARDRIAVLAALNLAFDLSDRDHAATGIPPAAEAGGHTDSMSTGPSPLGEPEHKTGSPETTMAANPQLSSLLDRLDVALRDDGRLI